MNSSNFGSSGEFVGQLVEYRCPPADGHRVGGKITPAGAESRTTTKAVASGGSSWGDGEELTTQRTSIGVFTQGAQRPGVTRANWLGKKDAAYEPRLSRNMAVIKGLASDPEARDSRLTHEFCGRGRISNLILLSRFRVGCILCERRGAIWKTPVHQRKELSRES